MNQLITLDHQLIQFINHLGTPFLDYFMIVFSNKYIWIPLYIFIIYKLYKKHQKNCYITILALIVIVILCDQTTSGFMKPFFERLRPCHDPNIKHSLRIINGCGGSFGFASSHACNSFGFAFFTFKIFNNRYYKYLLLWASFVSYSRVYLGVHFPSDIIVGAIIGCLIAEIVFRLTDIILTKKANAKVG